MTNHTAIAEAHAKAADAHDEAANAIAEGESDDTQSIAAHAKSAHAFDLARDKLAIRALRAATEALSALIDTPIGGSGDARDALERAEAAHRRAQKHHNTAAKAV